MPRKALVGEPRQVVSRITKSGDTEFPISYSLLKYFSNFSQSVIRGLLYKTIINLTEECREVLNNQDAAEFNKFVLSGFNNTDNEVIKCVSDTLSEDNISNLMPSMITILSCVAAFMVIPQVISKIKGSCFQDSLSADIIKQRVKTLNKEQIEGYFRLIEESAASNILEEGLDPHKEAIKAMKIPRLLCSDLSRYYDVLKISLYLPIFLMLDFSTSDLSKDKGDLWKVPLSALIKTISAESIDLFFRKSCSQDKYPQNKDRLIDDDFLEKIDDTEVLSELFEKIKAMMQKQSENYYFNKKEFVTKIIDSMASMTVIWGINTPSVAASSLKWGFRSIIGSSIDLFSQCLQGRHKREEDKSGEEEGLNLEGVENIDGVAQVNNSILNSQDIGLEKEASDSENEGNKQPETSTKRPSINQNPLEKEASDSENEGNKQPKTSTERPSIHKHPLDILDPKVNTH